MSLDDRLKWQKKTLPLLFPSKEHATIIGTDIFNLPSFEVYESKALLEVGRCNMLTKGGMDDLWIDGYTQPRFILKPMSLIDIQGEAVRLFCVQYYRHRGNLGQSKREPTNRFGGGFIIGDGTGVGKSREIAAMIICTILIEKYMNKNIYSIKDPLIEVYLNKLEYYNNPLIIWLTCSELLFSNCKKAFYEVLTLDNNCRKSSFTLTDDGLITSDLEGEDTYIRFINLKEFLIGINGTNDYSQMFPNPTVLFLTYNSLMTHFETIMNRFEKGNIIPSAIFCDEFHKTKNISDKLKTIVKDCCPQVTGENYFCLYKIMRNNNLLFRDKSNKIRLTIADSVKLFIDFFKYKSFLIMSSATPFQKNYDLHMIDHIIRNVAPQYHMLDKCDDTPEGMNSSEYSTLFLENIIKLLYNKGLYVSRTISMKGIRCSIVQRPISSANIYMLDEISCYLSEIKSLANIASEDILILKKKVDNIIGSKSWKSSSMMMANLREFSENINSGKYKEMVKRPGYRLYFLEWQKAWEYLYEKNGSSSPKKIKKDKGTLLSFKGDEKTSLVFSDLSSKLLSSQLKVSIAASCVSITKNILMSLKSDSVLKYIKGIRKQNELQKMILSVEQTGDSYYNHIVENLLKDNNDIKQNFEIIIDKLSIFDKAPASHYIVNAYKLLFKKMLLDTTCRINCLPEENMCFILLPRLPPSGPLTLLGENFIDTIQSQVGEGRYIEVTKRKFAGRIKSEGDLQVIPLNTSSKYIERNLELFKHSNSVDVAIVGRTGNTGFDFHDSKENIARARRVHILADLPHDAISFLQSTGRSHRNNQWSLPRYLLFLTNIPVEKRFVDSLETRVRDAKAGTYGDRYCQNTLSLKGKNNDTGNNGNLNNNTNSCHTKDNDTVNSISKHNKRKIEDIYNENDKNNDDQYPSNKTFKCFDKEDFLENDFVMKVLGTTMQLLAGEYNPLEIYLAIARLGYRDDYLFIPLEGLGGNMFYLNLVQFAFECAATLIGNQNMLSNVIFDYKYNLLARTTVSLINIAKRREVLDEILECLGYFYDSSIIDFGLRGISIENKHIDNIVNTAISFWECFRPRQMIKFSHILYRVNKSTRSNQLDLKTIFYNSAIKVFGYTKNKIMHLPPTHVVTISIHNETIKFFPNDVAFKIPIVAAYNLLDILNRKTPHLLFQLCNEITPYQNESDNITDSSLLSLSRLLVNKSLTYKQFRNYFMTIPLSEQYLLYSLFSMIRECLSTEERFSHMCLMRRVNHIAAFYKDIVTCPTDIDQLYAKLTKENIQNFTYGIDFNINCRLSLCNDNKDYDHNTINISRGDIDIQLTPKNTLFVSDLFDTLLLANIRHDMVKIKFYNSEAKGLPSIAFIKY
uniref:Wsv026-like protein n=1 Tax=Trachysalambria curvirostris majanivirus TaxID=2984281 RepID=A0A9C7F744_9VIRU|nr:MAG: wsv026-like protein [Trachysalambria curvirostris majanivirus]